MRRQRSRRRQLLTQPMTPGRFNHSTRTADPNIAVVLPSQPGHVLTKQYPAGIPCFMAKDADEAYGKPGAMWFEETAWDGWTGPDGKALYVVCPNKHVWCIDSRASNCTKSADDEHRCWIRHGTPPNVTVDKAGLTCAAGAGSIQCGDYHGFLRNGAFT